MIYNNVKSGLEAKSEFPQTHPARLPCFSCRLLILKISKHKGAFSDIRSTNNGHHSHYHSLQFNNLRVHSLLLILLTIFSEGMSCLYPSLQRLLCLHIGCPHYIHSLTTFFCWPPHRAIGDFSWELCAELFQRFAAKLNFFKMQISFSPFGTP